MSKVDIIIVEDNEQEAELMKQALRKRNLTNNLLRFSDGEELIAFLFNENSSLNIVKSLKVIFIDLKLSKSNSLAILQKIRSHPATDSIPVIMITSAFIDDEIKAAYALGANSYILKPVEFDNFSKAIREVGMSLMLSNKSN